MPSNSDTDLEDFLSTAFSAYKKAKKVLGTQRARPSVDPFSIMLRLADDETIKEIYLLLAKHFHPDRAGGNTEKMTMLNKCWEIIRHLRGMK